MDRKPKYSLFPTHPPSTPPCEPLLLLPEGQLPSPLAHTAFPRPPSRGSPVKSHATFPSLSLEEFPPQPHPAFSSPRPRGSSYQQPHAPYISPPPPPHQPHDATSSPEQGPSPRHFDPAFPPPLPHLPPSSPHVAIPPPLPQAHSTHFPREPPTPPAELEANNPWPSLNPSWPPHEDSTSTLKGTRTPAESTSSTRKKMDTPTRSTSTSSSQSSLHKPANIVTPPSQPQSNTSNTRPRTVYFHSGLGGAGNYHKAIREDNILKPMIGHRSTHPKFLSSLFGTLGGKKGRRHQQQQQYDGAGNVNCSDGTGSGHSSNQALPLGAAEVMRRKMLGLDGKARSKG